jgi:hypothetical protein
MFKNNITGLKTFDCDEITATNIITDNINGVSIQNINYLENVNSDIQTQINTINDDVDNLQSQITINTNNIASLNLNPNEAEWIDGTNVDNSILIFDNNNYDINTALIVWNENINYNTAVDKTLGTIIFQPKSYINPTITIFVSLAKQILLGGFASNSPQINNISTLNNLNISITKNNVEIYNKTITINQSTNFNWVGSPVPNTSQTNWVYKYYSFDVPLEDIFLENLTTYKLFINSINETHTNGFFNNGSNYLQMTNQSYFRVYASEINDQPITIYNKPISPTNQNEVMISKLSTNQIKIYPTFQVDVPWTGNGQTIHYLTINEEGLYIINNQGFITDNSGFVVEITCNLNNLYDTFEIVVINPSNYQANTSYYRVRIKFLLNFRSINSESNNDEISIGDWFNIRYRYSKFQILPCPTNALNPSITTGMFELIRI